LSDRRGNFDSKQIRGWMSFSSFISCKKYNMNVLTALYKELGERGNENKNVKYQTKISADLQKRLADGRASIYHIDIVS